MVAIVIGLLTGVAVIRGSQASGGRSASPFNETNLMIGYEVYQSDCSACHGYRLQGGPSWASAGRSAPALAGTGASNIWQKSDLQLFRIVTSEIDATKYRAAHQQFETSLAPPEVEAVIAFLKAHWTSRERVLQSVVSANPWSFPWPWRDLTWRAPPGCFGAE